MVERDANWAGNVLGVSAQAPMDAIRQAYRDLSKVWHPDRFVGDDRLRRIAENKQTEINLAYELLCGLKSKGEQDDAEVVAEPPRAPRPSEHGPSNFRDETKARRPGHSNNASERAPSNHAARPPSLIVEFGIGLATFVWTMTLECTAFVAYCTIFLFLPGLVFLAAAIWIGGTPDRPSPLAMLISLLFVAYVFVFGYYTMPRCTREGEGGFCAREFWRRLFVRLSRK